MLFLLFWIASGQLALPRKELILVRFIQISTFEGKIHAVDIEGAHQWTLETNRPLVSSYYSESAFDESPAPLIPTLAGEIVTLNNGNFVKLSQNIKELVAKPPGITSNRLYVGEKHLRAYTIDYSGNVLTYHEGAHRLTNDRSPDTVLIGLMDYIYKVFDSNTLEMIYNISYTELLSQHKTIAVHTSTLDLNKLYDKFSGAVTSIHSLDSSGQISHEFGYDTAIAKVKLNNLGSNMLYAEMVGEAVEGKNVFSLSHENPVLMLEGRTDNGSTYASAAIGMFGLIGVLWGLSKPKTQVKEVKKAEVSVGTPVIEEQKKIELFVDKILGHGSQGTTVFEGMFQERPVAVKRMLKNCIKEAKQEVAILIKADAHPNVVSFFAWEEDETFVYLAFEKCAGTLADVVSEGLKKKKKQSKFKKIPDLLKLLNDSARGLSYLHRLNIVHRDIKPMNILIDSKGTAKIADMASGKRLAKDVSSFGTQSHGSSGWQPKEVLLNQRRTKAVDIFSLGCSFYYTLTKGSHPFGSRIQRDNNILTSTYTLTGISAEARHLIEKMINDDFSKRPCIDYVYQHCFFWNSQTRLNFLQDISDLLEAEGNGCLLEIELESYCKGVLGRPWDESLGAEFIANLGKYRKYDHGSVKDLLRVIRNKMHHYHEMPESLKKIIGSLPDGYYTFFDKAFPMLFITLFDYFECSKHQLLLKYITI